MVFVSGVANTGNGLTWGDALTWSNNLASGYCGLADNSKAGQWRLPNITELESLLDAERSNPALTIGHPFSYINIYGEINYWSGSSNANNNSYAWVVRINSGAIGCNNKTYFSYNYVWPVRDRQ